jgi:HNH endonuclease
MRHDPDGRVVEIGARTRTIPPALRRALHHRDETCRFPGCRGRIREGHHVQHWARGGPTTLTNLIALCRRHHRAVHEEGYQVTRSADDVFQFRRPNGDAIPDVPPLAAVPADPVEAVRAENETRQVRITARTGCARWGGERLDLGWAIDVLHPRATAPGIVQGDSCDS